LPQACAAPHIKGKSANPELARHGGFIMKRRLLVLLALDIGAAALASCQQDLAPRAHGGAGRYSNQPPKEAPIGPGNFTFYFRDGSRQRNMYVDGYGLTPAKDWRSRDGKLTIYLNSKHIKDWEKPFADRGMKPSFDGPFMRFSDAYQLYGVENVAGEMTYAAPEANASYAAWSKAKQVLTLEFEGRPLLDFEGPVGYDSNKQKEQWLVMSGIELQDIVNAVKARGYEIEPFSETYPNVLTLVGNGKRWQAAIRDYRSSLVGIILSMRCFAFLENRVLLPPSRTDLVAFKHARTSYRFAFPEGGYLGEDGEFWFVEGDLSDSDWIAASYQYVTKERVFSDGKRNWEYCYFETDARTDTKTDDRLLVYRQRGDSGMICFPKGSWSLRGKKFD
jgi:hypothetical protein